MDMFQKENEELDYRVINASQNSIFHAEIVNVECYDGEETKDIEIRILDGVFKGHRYVISINNIPPRN